MTHQTFFKTKRHRSTKHMAFVATFPCCVCGTKPVQVHHLTCGPEPKARGLKAGDNWTVPLCVAHHHDLHMRGAERLWWECQSIDPMAVASRLWGLSVASGRVKL